ncbi:hypothetical protein BDV97DRAFT_57620 [Delphinella strobiligena]|nr:hypothetical protein BDV97DRAFT_57620 [Delphinella strobiligena]
MQARVVLSLRKTTHRHMTETQNGNRRGMRAFVFVPDQSPSYLCFFPALFSPSVQSWSMVLVTFVMGNSVLVEKLVSGVLKHFTCAHDDTFFLIYSRLCRVRLVIVSCSGGLGATGSVPEDLTIKDSFQSEKRIAPSGLFSFKDGVCTWVNLTGSLCDWLGGRGISGEDMAVWGGFSFTLSCDEETKAKVDHGSPLSNQSCGCQ